MMTEQRDRAGQQRCASHQGGDDNVPHHLENTSVAFAL
jgi:hypothetical protein